MDGYLHEVTLGTLGSRHLRSARRLRRGGPRFLHNGRLALL